MLQLLSPWNKDGRLDRVVTRSQEPGWDISRHLSDETFSWATYRVRQALTRHMAPAATKPVNGMLWAVTNKNSVWVWPRVPPQAINHPKAGNSSQIQRLENLWKIRRKAFVYNLTKTSDFSPFYLQHILQSMSKHLKPPLFNNSPSRRFQGPVGKHKPRLLMCSRLERKIWVLSSLLPNVKQVPLHCQMQGSGD